MKAFGLGVGHGLETEPIQCKHDKQANEDDGKGFDHNKGLLKKFMTLVKSSLAKGKV